MQIEEIQHTFILTHNGFCPAPIDGKHTYLFNIKPVYSDLHQKIGYEVDFPELPGCISFGKTLKQALNYAVDCYLQYATSLNDLKSNCGERHANK